MKYPEWLDYATSESRLLQEALGINNFVRLGEMAKDAWDMAYNAGVEGHEALTPGQFCEKYGDKK